MTLPSPLSDCDTMWNSSEVPQMSPPPPTSLHTPPDSESEPGGAGPPMSWHVHAEGHPGDDAAVLTDTVSSVTAEPVPWLWEVMAKPASRGSLRDSTTVEPGTAVHVVPSGDV